MAPHLDLSLVHYLDHLKGVMREIDWAFRLVPRLDVGWVRLMACHLALSSVHHWVHLKDPMMETDWALHLDGDWA